VALDRVRLAVDAPFAIYQDGEAAVVGGERLTAASSPAFGDLRLAADVRVIGDHGAPFSLAVGARGWLPTGLRSQFTSDDSIRISPQVLAAGALGVFVWATRLAVVYRSRDDAYAGRSLGSEIFAAAGAGLRSRNDRLFVGPELAAASTFTSGATFLGKRETPVEWSFGAHYDLLPRVRAGAGVGGGLGHGYGAPLLRGLVSIEWVTAPVRVAQHEDIAPPEEHTPWEGGGEEAPAPRKPLAVMTESEIRIEEQLRFATDSAELVGESDAVLAAVKRVLEEHPEVRIRIEGHTDSVGDPAYNDDLSARRAESVKGWLVRNGIDPSRLESVGLGSKEPIDTNDTEAGRAKNRRVVFRILE
jgi:outer membrane protein OmpA-like peptidoglycan-associated protein